MTQIQFLLELDDLGLSVCHSFDTIGIFKDSKQVATWPATLRDLTYQNRIDIIRECKRNLK